MSKIICEICGTKYPDTADQCPICGYTNDVTAKSEMEEEVLEEVIREARPKAKGGRFSKSKTRKQKEEEILPEEEDEEEPEYDEDDYDDDESDDDEYEDDDDDDDEDDDDDDEDDDDDDDDDDDEGKSGVVLNILLGIVIVALLCVSGFIFVKYFLPNVMDGKETVPTTEPYIETEAPETEAPAIPCVEIRMEDTEVTLNEIGQMYLLNVEVSPADTTDELLFTSDDETVATVNEEGRVTAVGEGNTVIRIVCGDMATECVVVVETVPETEAPTEEPTEAPTEEPTEEPTEPGVTKVVVSDWVKIRSGPGTEYKEVGKYVEGDKVVIYEEKTCAKGRPWGRTDKGWICTEYVK